MTTEGSSIGDWPLIAPPMKDAVGPGRSPTFSVIIAAFEAASTIGDAVRSVTTQTAPPEEIIVCDDGSTDSPERALAPWQGHVSIIRQANGGEGSAKNRAARAARGDVVVVLDADDTFLPRRLEALNAVMTARPDLDVVTTDAHLVSGGSILRRAYDSSWPFVTTDQRRAILTDNFIFGHTAIRRSALEAAGGFDPAMRTLADWDLWIRMILGGSQVGLIPEPLSTYAVHASSISSNRRPYLKGRLTTLERAARNPTLRPEERDLVDASVRRASAEFAVVDARTALRDGEPDARRRALALVRDSRVGLPLRVKALAGAVAPSLTGRAIRRSDSQSFVGTAGLRLPRARETR